MLPPTPTFAATTKNKSGSRIIDQTKIFSIKPKLVSLEGCIIFATEVDTIKEY